MSCYINFGYPKTPEERAEREKYDAGRTVNKKTSKQLLAEWAMKPFAESNTGTNSLGAYQCCTELLKK